MPPITHLLYLHGFRSSPRSTKARMVCERLASRHPEVTVWCPQLPPSPREAMALLQSGTAHWPSASMGVVGSSLGGFYATHLAQTRGCLAAVLNPAVNPARDLAKYIGEHSSWHDPQDTFFFRSSYVDELQALTLGELSAPQHFYALIAKGDEVLDWREMQARYAQAQVHLLEGGDHALSGFEAHIDEVLAFFGLGD
jgi:predicted esterase YcpF (UPF0227 family)